MNRETITLTKTEEQRAHVLARVQAGIVTAQTAAELLADINRVIEEYKKEVGDDEDRQLQLDWMYEDRGLVIEDFLGLSFVACQTFIRRVTEQLKTLHKRGHVPSPLTTTNGNPIQMRQFGSQRQPSDIDVLWEFANCYKHKDDWGDELPIAVFHVLPRWSARYAVSASAFSGLQSISATPTTTVT